MSLSPWTPSLNALRAFEAVARHLNYNLAAEELRVTPAAVKQQVKRLEEALGVALVRRRGRGLVLTPEGRTGVADLTAGMAHFGAAVRKIRGAGPGPHLVVSVETSLASTWLVPRLDAFCALHRDISVRIDSSQEIIDLDRNAVDVAIRYGIAPENAGYGFRLFDDVIFPVCSRRVAEGPPALSSLRDLSRVPLIHWDVSNIPWAHATRQCFLWENWLVRVGAEPVSVDGGVHFSDYGQAVQAALAGQGVVLASLPILRDLIEAGDLVAPFAEVLRSDTGYDVVTRAGAAQRPEVRAFTDWIREAARREGADTA